VNAARRQQRYPVVLITSHDDGTKPGRSAHTALFWGGVLRLLCLNALRFPFLPSLLGFFFLADAGINVAGKSCRLRLPDGPTLVLRSS
jgi:hypothetical protein